MFHDLDTAVDTDRFGQPIGLPIADTSVRPQPPRTPIDGRWCRVVPLDLAAHARTLFDGFAAAPDDRDWSYLPYGPFEDFAAFTAWMSATCLGPDPLFHAVLTPDGRPVGLASLMRIVPEHGVIEVGHIHFGPALQRTPAATEAIFLLMRRVFDDLGYRRFEWKCNALNARSCRAALRFGFRYEGTFRQMQISKGRNRDTAWFSLLDREWPAVRAAFDTWLDQGNFDSEGRQRRSLRELMPKDVAIAEPATGAPAEA
jgi:RimJ/RimL family protein N-acetyltransferase